MTEDISFTSYELENLRSMERSNDQERALQRYKTKMRTIGFATLVVGATIIGLALIVWQGNKGPSAEQQIDERLRSQCIEREGNWVELEVGNTKGRGTCVWNGSGDGN